MRRHTYAATGVLFTAALCFGFPGIAHAQDDQNCSDFVTQQAAQDHFNQDTSDPDNLDADNNGIACETLNGVAEDVVTTTPATTTSATTTGTTSTTTTDPTTTADTTTTTDPTTTADTTAATSSQVVIQPSGGVGTGDGSTAENGGSGVPYVVGGVVLIAAGGGAAYSAGPKARDAGPLTVPRALLR